MDWDTVFLALRVVVALGAVFGALLFAHRWATKGRPGGTARVGRIAVVARQGLGAKAGVAIVDAGGRRYLLGVTEHAVTVLDTLGAAEPATDPHRPSTSPIPTAPVALGGFAREMQRAALTTGPVPTIVHGPEGEWPVTDTITIRPSAAPTTRRALREAEQQREAQATRTQQAPQQGPLAGSLLSPETWRQTAGLFKRQR